MIYDHLKLIKIKIFWESKYMLKKISQIFVSITCKTKKYGLTVLTYKGYSNEKKFK